jgi:superoxide dismutase
LEPHISGEIMELHHDKHHATYVKGLNTVLEKLEEARASESFDSVGGLEKNLAFNLGGHINHSVFWPNMSPKAVTNRSVTWPRRSMNTSEASTSSEPTSKRTPQRSKALAGRCWSGTRSASD